LRILSSKRGLYLKGLNYLNKKYKLLKRAYQRSEIIKKGKKHKKMRKYIYTAQLEDEYTDEVIAKIYSYSIEGLMEEVYKLERAKENDEMCLDKY
jgi:hypothetical protein